MNAQKSIKNKLFPGILCFMLSALPSIFPDIPYAQQDNYKIEKKIKASSGTLYTKPDKNSSIIDILKQGDSVSLVDQEGEWYIGRLPDDSLGWVHRDLFINKDDSAFYDEQVQDDPDSKKEQIISKQEKSENKDSPEPQEKEVSEKKLEELFKAVVKVKSGNVRQGPTTESDVRFGIKKGEIISVKNTKAKWYFIENADGRTGWAHQVLFSKNLPKRIEGIRVEGSSGGDEKVIFNLSGFFPPKTFAYDDENNEPKVVCDFLGTALAQGIDKSIPVGGKLVQKLRVGFHDSPESKVRIVVDLDPDRKYGVDQVFYKKTNLYVLTFRPVK